MLGDSARDYQLLLQHVYIILLKLKLKGIVWKFNS